MLHSTIQRFSSERPDQLCVTRGGDEATYAEIASASEELIRAWSDTPPARVGVFMPNGPEMIIALAALDALEAGAFLGSPMWSEEERARAIERYELDASIVGDDASALTRVVSPSEARESAVTIFTSGTTGVPKAARHSWASLASPTRVSQRFAGTNWLLAYPLHLYAGLQVFCQAVFNGAAAHMPPGDDAEAVIDMLVDRRVEYASATPSFWRRLALFGDTQRLRRAPLKQITLGGEPIDQPILDTLRELFPHAKLLHIYASSEMGRVLAVDDGLAGVPESFLEKNPESGVELRVEDGQLLVRSTHSMSRYDERCPVQVEATGWFATGDLIELRNGRAHFVGRASEIINVGGHKVSPIEVESVVRSVPGVADCRVYAVSSSIVGQMVACELVVEQGSDAEGVKLDVARACAERLTPAQRPRKLSTVDSIALSGAGKVVRSA